MRVTNTMISNSAKNHISNAKNKLLKYGEQYTSQQKIQRPSDDPTVAVRSLKLRTTYSQVTQYVEKNVQDALNWMDLTEGALTNIGKMLTTMKGFLVQGNVDEDEMEADQRKSVIQTLKKNVEGIFQNEANTDYSGRYLFTGYRTDTPLLFSEVTDNLEYKITEKFTYDSFRNVTSVIGGPSYNTDTGTGQEYVDSAATTTTAYRLQLAYNNCATEVNFETDMDEAIQFTFTNKEGEDVTDSILTGGLRIELSTSSSTVRQVADDEVLYLYDTGEVLVGKDVFNAIQENQATVNVNYLKSEFKQFDVRPEMYFKAECYNTVTEKSIKYSEPADQTIRYEVNFNQTINVNTQAKDAISTDIYRTIEYIEQNIQYLDESETKIEECDKLIKNTTDEEELAKLKSLKITLEDERQLRVKVLSESFGIGLTMIDTVQVKLDIAVADLGAKYNRTQLTYDKLLDTRLDTEDKLSENEGVSLPDVLINMTQANNLYQASLSATSKILGNSLLNYI